MSSHTAIKDLFGIRIDKFLSSLSDEAKRKMWPIVNALRLELELSGSTRRKGVRYLFLVFLFSVMLIQVQVSLRYCSPTRFLRMETLASRHGVFFLISLLHLRKVYWPTSHNNPVFQPAIQKACSSVLASHSSVSKHSTSANPLFSPLVPHGEGFFLHIDILEENSYRPALETTWISPGRDVRIQ